MLPFLWLCLYHHMNPSNIQHYSVMPYELVLFSYLPILFFITDWASAHLFKVVDFSTACTCIFIDWALSWLMIYVTVVAFSHGHDNFVSRCHHIWLTVGVFAHILMSYSLGSSMNLLICHLTGVLYYCEVIDYLTCNCFVIYAISNLLF